MSPEGRFGRVDYLLYSMGSTLILYLFMGIAFLVGKASEILSLIIMGIAYVAILVIACIFMIRRFHDLDKSGYWTFLAFIPVANLIAMIMLVFMRGTEGTNTYGNPRRPPSTVRTAIACIFPAMVFIGIFAAVAIPSYQAYKVKAASMQHR